MELSASGIVAPASRDPEPFRISTLMPEDTFAVIAITKMAFVTGWANIISALT